MRRVWAVVFLAGCTEVANPLFCDENSDCRNGTICNRATNGCEMAPDGAVDGPMSDDGPFVARTVQEVRAATTPEDTPVELHGVIVTAVDLYGNWNGDFWIQQPGGGLQSGIHVFGAPMADVEVLNVGDVINLSGGRKVLYAAAMDESGRREIEITPTVLGTLQITRTGTTMAPTVMMVDPESLVLSPSQLAEALEALAGGYIRIGPIRAEGAPTEGPPTEPTLFNFAIRSFNVQSSMAEFPSGIVEDTCFEAIEGVVEYRFEYNLTPRTTGDVVIGSNCP